MIQNVLQEDFAKNFRIKFNVIKEKFYTICQTMCAKVKLE